jgi:hypothetical protein
MASVRGTAVMIAEFAPADERHEWLMTLVAIRKLPERRTRRWS